LRALDHAELIDLKQTSIDTGAMKKGLSKELSFSYSFDSEADNKVINLELAVVFANKIIKTQKISLKPH